MTLYNTPMFVLMVWITWLLPMISGIICFVIPTRYSWLISITAPLMLLITMISGASLFFELPQGTVYWETMDWITIGDQTIKFGFYIDNMSASMIFVVSLISCLVHIYSTGYMAGDPAVKKYFGMLGFFTFSMIGLVIGENLLLIFMAWELVGFSSYILIGHWNEQHVAGAAAKKAFLMNRIGDIGFVVGLFIIYHQTQTFQLTALMQGPGSSWHTWASLCLFCGVIGKSAQFPLLTWLPDAMAGPTPVSALIHAATMVAAGVFLLGRTFFLFSPEALTIVTLVGALTGVWGGIMALFPYDIKKILAYSTISQLGFMVLAMGVGSPESSMLHLFTHAFFKAGLFLGAGSVIHALHQIQHKKNLHFDVQDIRNLGGLSRKLPITFLVFVCCGASLAGIPFFSGFLSKDAIFSSVIHWAHAGHVARWGIVGLSFLISLLTIFYTFRLIWFVFLSTNHSTGKVADLPINESPAVMRFPMILMAVCSTWWVVSNSPFDPSGWQYTFPHNTIITSISIIWVFIGFIAALFYYRKKQQTSAAPLYLEHGLYLDSFYKNFIIGPFIGLAKGTRHLDNAWIDGIIHFTVYSQVTLAHLASWFDKVVVDGGVKLLGTITALIGSLVRLFQGGKIQHYIFWSVICITILWFLLL